MFCAVPAWWRFQFVRFAADEKAAAVRSRRLRPVPETLATADRGGRSLRGLRGWRNERGQ